MRAARPSVTGIDKLGVLVAGLLVAGALLPFASFRATRILLGEPRSLVEALPAPEAALFGIVVAAAGIVALLRSPPRARLAASAIGLLASAIAIGRAADVLTPEGDTFARVGPGSGFWLILAGLGLLLADALTRLRLSPQGRIAALATGAVALAGLLLSGIWSDLSVLREYAVRADAFWAEARRHVLLAFGSLGAASLVGIPLGIALTRAPALRAGVLNVLNMIQTIPSIALFGLLIAPLAWIAASVPGASALGISGIGVAPAFVALFAYSLLPVVANTLVGLDGVPRQAREAARGMGMTQVQRLAQVELPLAFPVVLTGVRIVLVQNIGLATIAALIGGGGFGVFVFQGIGQTASDLVLLGALPTVVLAVSSAIVLDALVELSERPGASSGAAAGGTGAAR
ncbi:ABC transporter permease [Salinarimonas sp.]|uniref:ABC transporter permease n=1 Tax=Salinarimonas sp. TaxID=2766526 RepID=UPI003919617E